MPKFIVINKQGNIFSHFHNEFHTFKCLLVIALNEKEFKCYKLLVINKEMSIEFFNVIPNYTLFWSNKMLFNNQNV